ncbi:ester cyclase [Haladaptatus sp. NG-SE-30]
MATPHENKEHVQRVESAVNEQDQAILSEIFAEDFIVHFHGGREELHGLDEYLDYLEEFYEAFPDLTINFEEMVAEDDMVTVRYTGSGTHEGEYQGIEPTGRTVDVSGMRIVRVADGEIVEVWGQRDDLGMLDQLGIVEPPTA